MQALPARLYTWLGRWYLVAHLGVQLLIVAAMTLLSICIAARYEGLPVHQAVTTCLIVLAGLPIVALLAAHQRAEPALHDWVWGRRDAEQAALVWQQAPLAPRRTSIRFGLTIASVLFPLTIAAFWIARDQTGVELVMLVLGAMTGVFYCAGAHHLFLELALRPVLRDAAAHLPAEPDAERGTIPLGWRLFLGLFAIGVVSGAIASGIETPFGSGAWTFLRDFGVVVAVVVTFSLVLSAAVTATILAPTRDLLQATRRVRQGDLDVRVAVVADDQHAALGRGFNEMVAGLQQREALRAALGNYVDPVVAERVLSGGAEEAGEAAEVTVMFVDIVGFTALAQDAQPDAVVDRLNAFFELVVPIIEHHGGHANKLLGDGLMAVFGVPARLPDHADRALRAAAGIERALQQRVKVGIGLHSGMVVAGSMGGGGKLDYTIVGDAVNLASRVEAHTRVTGDTILMTEQTRVRLSSDGFGVVPRGAQALRGRSGEVVLYAVTDTAA